MTLHSLQLIHGRRSNTPALVKHAIRFGRRLREHRIYSYTLPPFIDDGATVCKVAVGRRVVNIFNDGSFTASLRSTDRNIYDNGAFRAQSNRMHAIFLIMARDARARGLKAHARTDLQLASQERLHHERRS